MFTNIAGDPCFSDVHCKVNTFSSGKQKTKMPHESQESDRSTSSSLVTREAESRRPLRLSEHERSDPDTEHGAQDHDAFHRSKSSWGQRTHQEESQVSQPLRDRNRASS